MGLFDMFMRKAARAVSNTITDTIIDNTVKPAVEQSVKNNLGIRNVKYDIPSTYSEFPEYPSSMISKPCETTTDKYTRLTINYSGSVKSEYENILLSNGYTKGSSVRYDKGNTYVIVENLGGNTKIAYHIKR